MTNNRGFQAALLLLLVAAGLGCAASQHPAGELPVVADVDLSRYTGTWHEIARYPHGFQEGCVTSTAHYELREDGRLAVVNRCRTAAGSVREAEGVARVADAVNKAKLEVSFFWPFWGDYWIVELGDDYGYAVVGHPSRKYLWILSREPHMIESRYGEILERLARLGYDPARLIRSSELVPGA